MTTARTDRCCHPEGFPEHPAQVASSIIAGSRQPQPLWIGRPEPTSMGGRPTVNSRKRAATRQLRGSGITAHVPNRRICALPACVPVKSQAAPNRRSALQAKRRLDDDHFPSQGLPEGRSCRIGAGTAYGTSVLADQAVHVSGLENHRLPDWDLAHERHPSARRCGSGRQPPVCGDSQGSCHAGIPARGPSSSAPISATWRSSARRSTGDCQSGASPAGPS